MAELVAGPFDGYRVCVNSPRDYIIVTLPADQQKRLIVNTGQASPAPLEYIEHRYRFNRWRIDDVAVFVFVESVRTL